MATSAPAEESSSSSLRRLACDACRARKVRCDRQDPPCSRCAKVGNTCRYSSRSKPTPSKMDLSRFLVTLNNRLKQAEAQLATSHMLQPSPPFGMSWSDVSMDMGPTASTISTTSPQSSSPRAVTPPQLASNHTSVLGLPIDKAASEWPHQLGGCDASDFQLDLFPTPMSSESLLGQATQAFPFDSIFTPNVGSSPTRCPVSPGLMQGLYDRYFEIFHPIMPIINRTRFQAEISQPFASTEAQALANAIGALGAFSVPDLRCYVDRCYEEARNLLDVCERQESGQALTNVNVLQACALLTLYEFKRPNFARAWMTLGRAIRLAKMMGFGGGNGAGQPCIVTPWGARMQLPVPSGTGDMEERRRTFWVLYVFDAFSSLRTNTGLSFSPPMHVALPSQGEYPDLGPDMPSLHQVFEAEGKPSLSSFAGTTIMVSLYQRCFEHIQSSQHEASHAFWETHYSIDKALAHCRNSVMAQHMNSSGSQGTTAAAGASSRHSSRHSSTSAPSDQDPISLAIRMNIAAIEVSLHEAALAKVEREKLPPGLAAEAVSKCMAAASEVVSAVQLGRRLGDRRAEIFQQLDQFLVWPMTTAIQVCFRGLLHREGDHVERFVAMLDVLVKAMRDFIDPDHIAPGLLDKAEASVAEAEAAAKNQGAMDD
ncbi:hypothetical protein CDD81_3696 [Ophiocordyceps australis]|uniref:Zn(2)-C6 fungal-type domain-containing protein n=1 Tax=Ophiocordyceps australis TaxID=1399860 RepID=A0A2C5XDZ6_9HYPO|nr:hypothetical protein CDD81_3696 [Ophiocordyceps australis]